LVLFHHAAIIYGASGDWHYTAVHTGPDLSSRLLSLFAGFNQAFFMGLFFLLAGYFTSGAVARHGAGAYMRERALSSACPSSSISCCSHPPRWRSPRRRAGGISSTRLSPTGRMGAWSRAPRGLARRC
jgi:hypothetical protein